MQAGEASSSHEYVGTLNLVRNWQLTPGAKRYVNALIRYNRRKTFGLLESPYNNEFTNYDVLMISKKLYLAGKAGVGKTSTADKLAGRDINKRHQETAGIQTHTLFWPFKLESSGRVVVAQLELWDAGEKSLQKFDHIRPTCLNSTHGTMLFFSYEDRKSWEDLPHLMSLLNIDHGDALKVVVGTHADSLQREVTASEVEEFETSYGVSVLPIDNTAGPRLSTNPSVPDGKEGIKEISSFMNTLMEVVLAHERRQPDSEFMKALHEATSTLQPPANDQAM